MKYRVHAVGDRWVIRNPRGKIVLSTSRFGAAVWLADNFAARACVREGMRSFGEEHRASVPTP